MKTQKIRVLFHTVQGEEPVGWAISCLTWVYALFYGWKALRFNYTHVEIHLPFEYSDSCTWKIEIGQGFNRRSFMYIGRCFSSTTRGDAEGVRFAPASEVLKHPERWHYIEIEVDAESLEVAVQEAERLARKKLKYDFLGILGFLNPFPVQNKNKYYCSELCNWFLSLCKYRTEEMWAGKWYVKARVMKLDKRISPRRMAYELAKTFGEPKELK